MFSKILFTVCFFGLFLTPKAQSAAGNPGNEVHVNNIAQAANFNNIPGVGSMGNFTSMIPAGMSGGSVPGMSNIPGVGNFASIPGLGNMGNSTSTGNEFNINNIAQASNFNNIPGVGNMGNFSSMIPAGMSGGSVPGMNNIPGGGNMGNFASIIPAGMSGGSVPGMSNIPGVGNMGNNTSTGNEFNINNIAQASNFNNIPGLGGMGNYTSMIPTGMSGGSVPGMSNVPGITQFMSTIQQQSQNSGSGSSSTTTGSKP